MLWRLGQTISLFSINPHLNLSNNYFIGGNPHPFHLLTLICIPYCIHLIVYTLLYGPLYTPYDTHLIVHTLLYTPYYMNLYMHLIIYAILYTPYYIYLIIYTLLYAFFKPRIAHQLAIQEHSTKYK